MDPATPWHDPGKSFVMPAHWDARDQMPNLPKRVWIKDATCQEGEDALGVQFSWADRVEMACRSFETGVTELKMPYYTRVEETGAFIKELNHRGVTCRKSFVQFFKLPYAPGFDWRDGLKRRIDLGVDTMELGLLTDASDIVSDFAAGLSKQEVIDRIQEMVSYTLEQGLPEAGYGHPWGTSLRVQTSLELHKAAVEAGAKRIFVWDSNGIGVPSGVSRLVSRLKDVVGPAQIVYHGHNDLGTGTANNLAAVEAGAEWCDLTWNGLGDRSGNSSMEEVVLVLSLYGIETGIKLDKIYGMSQLVQELSRAPVQAWKPVVGSQSCIEEGEAHYHIARRAKQQGLPEHPMGYNPEIVGRKYTNVFGSTTLRGAISWGSMIENKLADWGMAYTNEGLEAVRDKLAARVKDRGYVTEDELHDIAQSVLGG